MIGLETQAPHGHRHARFGEVTIIPMATKAALQRLCGFYGGSERELIARLISDLERDTLANLPRAERDDYFTIAA